MYKVSNLKQEYKKKLITAEQAAAMVKPGDRLHFGLGCGSIVDIDRAIAKRAGELKDITVLSTVTIREKPFETYLATESNDQVSLRPLISAATTELCQKRVDAGTYR